MGKKSEPTSDDHMCKIINQNTNKNIQKYETSLNQKYRNKSCVKQAVNNSLKSSVKQSASINTPETVNKFYIENVINYFHLA